MNESQEVIVTDWNAEVSVNLTLKDLWTCWTALGFITPSQQRDEIIDYKFSGSLPEGFKNHSVATLYDSINHMTTYERFGEILNDASLENTYKEYDQKQYKISYIRGEEKGQEYYLNIDEAIKRYKEIIAGSSLFSNMKLESVSSKSKVKLSDLNSVNNLK